MRTRLHPGWIGLYLAACGVMVVIFMRAGIPVYGHSWLPCFGKKSVSGMSGPFREWIDPLIIEGYGYDGQFYAWLATDPFLQQEGTAGGFDNFQFRARRPLFALTAFLLGSGEPRAVLQAYSLQNLIFWFGFAGLLLFWLPPVSGGNAFRYLAVLFSIGWIDSLTRALIDGPALTLLTFALFLTAIGRRGWGTVVLSLAALGRETSVLALPALADGPPLRRGDLLRFGARAALVVLPLVLWLIYLSGIPVTTYSSHFGNSRLLSLPFVGCRDAVRVLAAKIAAGQDPVQSVVTASFLIGMSVQAVSLLVIRKPRDPWWRVGVAYAVLSFFIGYSAWGGLWGSVTRVCLPLTTAFNIVLPRTRAWLAILILGNSLAGVGWYALLTWKSPASPSDALIPQALAADYFVVWQSGWYDQEQDAHSFWRWASGPAAFDIHSVHDGISVNLIFQTRSVQPMDITVEVQGRRVAVFPSNAEMSDLKTIRIPLRAGVNRVEFRPNAFSGRFPNDDRELSFQLFQPQVQRADEP